MTVNFNILKGNISWNALIHQLNSDILLRHILMCGNVDTVDLQLSYCEDTGKGKILNNDNQLIGNFSTYF
ncbi:hypothetical protein [Photobacterium sanguinicancri]|uniref:hypothetical protein n=1 Tax=Photobacterium sanguinicancri TaxID=875932 RepID=UPI0026E2433D|nr:hypothetical protein [Photobacterium sanguinicancri]MDO6498308.1 hypothetical protein [Photobacterium sanguinicancri]